MSPEWSGGGWGTATHNLLSHYIITWTSVLGGAPNHSHIVEWHASIKNRSISVTHFLYEKGTTIVTSDQHQSTVDVFLARIMTRCRGANSHRNVLIRARERRHLNSRQTTNAYQFDVGTANGLSHADIAVDHSRAVKTDEPASICSSGGQVEV